MKFYSAINQAITLSEVDYGDRENWTYASHPDVSMDIKGNPVPGKTDREKWFNKYLAPYMKITETKYDTDGYPIFYFADGSGLKYVHQTSLRDWMFLTSDVRKCRKHSPTTGVCAFAFFYGPPKKTDADYEAIMHVNGMGRNFEPYRYNWDGTIEGFKNGNNTVYYGCNSISASYCAAYIQYNGWKIPDDYPFKVRY